MNKAAKIVKSDQGPESMLFKDRCLWMLVVLLFVGGFVANYVYLEALAPYFKVLGWMALLAVMCGLAMLTYQGKTFFTFAKSARAEMRKVFWPSRQETVQMTMLVIAMVIVVGLFLWMCDAFFMWLVSWLTGQRG
jgi:preprotein translocase subunit SecE